MNFFYSFLSIFNLLNRIFFLFVCVSLFSCTHTGSPVPKIVKKKGQSLEQSSFFVEGVELFNKGKIDEAQDQFELLNRGDKDFISGLLEIQKINYIQNDWDHFFGLALYYRTILLSSYGASLFNFRQEFLALEILALIRHCRFYESKQLIKWSMELAKKTRKDYSKIKKTVYFFNLDKLIGDQQPDKGKIDWGERIYLWPLNLKELKHLDNPKYLRVKVKSQC